MPFEKANLQTNKSSHLFSKKSVHCVPGSPVFLVSGPWFSVFDFGFAFGFGFGFGFGPGCRRNRWYLKMAMTRRAPFRLRGLLDCRIGSDRIGSDGMGWDRCGCHCCSCFYFCCCTMQLLTSKVMRGKPKANTRRSNIKGQARPYGGCWGYAGRGTIAIPGPTL